MVERRVLLTTLNNVDSKTLFNDYVVFNSPEQVVRFLLFKGNGAALVGYIVMLRARMFLPLIPVLIAWSDQ